MTPAKAPSGWHSPTCHLTPHDTGERAVRLALADLPPDPAKTDPHTARMRADAVINFIMETFQSFESRKPGKIGLK